MMPQTNGDSHRIEVKSASDMRFVPFIKSPLPDVSDEAWAKFVRAMDSGNVQTITPSGGYGAFDMRPRRLVELGYAKGLTRGKYGRRLIWKCDFLPPWTETKFLQDPFAQYAAFRSSMIKYAEALRTGAHVRPAKCSLSGALAILHVGGHGALSKFPALFSSTQKVYDAAKGIF